MDSWHSRPEHWVILLCSGPWVGGALILGPVGRALGGPRVLMQNARMTAEVVLCLGLPCILVGFSAQSVREILLIWLV